MARGPKKHLKRLVAPKSWMLGKLGGTWAPRPAAGPHKLRESLPLIIALRNRLKYALTRREAQMIVMRRLVEVDHKVRTELNYPAGLMDVIRIAKTNQAFRLLFDIKGHYVLTKVKGEEANRKLCRVIRISKAKKSIIGRNTLAHGQMSSIPYAVTHDGRTIRYPDPNVKVNDTVELNLNTGKINRFAKFETGNVVLITKGANIGRVGTIVNREKHPGSFDIVHIKDALNNTFATRIGNVFVIGQGNQSWITLPKQNGAKLSIIEERQAKLSGGKKRKSAKKD